MKIYTSYFSKANNLKECGIVPISIALWPPKYYQGAAMSFLAPKRWMMQSGVTREQYIEGYRMEVLGHLAPESVIQSIGYLSKGKDAALLCYEKPGDFCHRRLLADWMLEQTGLEIPEFGVVQEKKEEPEMIEPTLW